MTVTVVRGDKTYLTYVDPKAVAEAFVVENMERTQEGVLETVGPDGGERRFRFVSQIALRFVDVPWSSFEAIESAVTELFERRNDDGFVLLPVLWVAFSIGDGTTDSPIYVPSMSDDEQNGETVRVMIILYIDARRISKDTCPLP
jgi:hypothetical protein